MSACNGIEPISSGNHLLWRKARYLSLIFNLHPNVLSLCHAEIRNVSMVTRKRLRKRHRGLASIQLDSAFCAVYILWCIRLSRWSFTSKENGLGRFGFAAVSKPRTGKPAWQKQSGIVRGWIGKSWARISVYICVLTFRIDKTRSNGIGATCTSCGFWVTMFCVGDIAHATKAVQNTTLNTAIIFCGRTFFLTKLREQSQPLTCSKFNIICTASHLEVSCIAQTSE